MKFTAVGLRLVEPFQLLVPDIVRINHGADLPSRISTSPAVAVYPSHSNQRTGMSTTKQQTSVDVKRISITWQITTKRILSNKKNG